MLLSPICHVLIFLHVLSSTTPSAIPSSSSTLPSPDATPHSNTTYPSFLFSNSANMGNEGMVWLPFRQSELKGLLFDLPWLVEGTRTVLLKWIIRKCLYMSNNHSDICSLKGLISFWSLCVDLSIVQIPSSCIVLIIALLIL